MIIKLKLTENQLIDFCKFADETQIFPTVTYSVEDFMSLSIKLIFHLPEEKAQLLIAKYPTAKTI